MSRQHFLLLVFTIIPLVSGWGGLFTRFNPGLFGSFGYGDDASGLNTVNEEVSFVFEIVMGAGQNFLTMVRVGSGQPSLVWV